MRGSILQFFSLVLDQLPSDLVRILPIHSEANHPRALVPLQNQVQETCRGPLEGVQDEHALFGECTKGSEAVKDDRHPGSCGRGNEFVQ